MHCVHFESALPTVSFSLGIETGETAEGSEGQVASHPLLGRFFSSRLHFSAVEGFRSIHDVSAKLGDLMLMCLNMSSKKGCANHIANAKMTRSLF